MRRFCGGFFCKDFLGEKTNSERKLRYRSFMLIVIILNNPLSVLNSSKD